MSFSTKLKDKKFLTLLIIILILGTFIRFHNYTETGYWTDDMATIPSGLLWYHPTNYFPTLSEAGKPPVGSLIIGTGCILSGEDFSQVSQIQKNFYVGREPLIGQQLINATNYCHFPVFLFGLFFLIIMSILAISLLGKYSSLFFISLISFFPIILLYSRWIHEDVIFWTFISLVLLFLWKAYTTEKYSKQEKTYFFLSFSFLGLSLATKFTGGMFLLFGIFILLNKYKQEVLSIIKNKIDENPRLKKFWEITIISLILFLFIFFLPFKLSLTNVIDVYQQFKTNFPETASLTLNTDFLDTIHKFLVKFNVIDLILFVFSLYILVKLITKKEKSKNEKFILYLTILFILSLLFFPTLNSLRITLPFILAIFLLMSLAFSNKEYSLFNKFKIQNKRKYFTIFLIIYLIISFSIAFTTSPYFVSTNPVTCLFKSEKCNKQHSLSVFANKEVGEYLNKNMQEDETFIGMSGVLFFYTRREQGALDWQFYNQFRKQFGREPELNEKVSLFKPNNREIRFILIDLINPRFGKQGEMLKSTLVPNHIISLKGEELVYIYDLKSPVPK